jgi:hypothetical protein
MPHDAITQVAWRLMVVHAARAASAGIVIGALSATAMSFTGVPLVAAVTLGLMFGLLSTTLVWRAGHARRGLAAAAATIERVHPAHNVIVTAEELGRHPDRAGPLMRALVETKAERHLASLEVSSIVAFRSAAAALAVAVAALLVAILLIRSPRAVLQTMARVQQTATGMVSGTPAFTLRVRIEPPSYTGRPSVTLEEPERLDVLEGTVIRFDDAGGIRVRFGDEHFEGDFVAREGGYFAIEWAGMDGNRLLPLIVTADSVPTVRVEDPGKDLLLGVTGRTIPVKFTAADDLALAAMELRYTKVSGSGEQFEFQEGTLPIALERRSAQEWHGRGQLALADLRLESGDSLVYRVIARDRRPGDAGLGSSETYFVEIAGPGHVPLEGVEMPPDMERYALSQQMIVVKLERLRARETSIGRAALIEEAAGIAAEQRAVRANFIFLMGGHVDDEEAEAEQSHEIQEGRLENTARRDINRAIGHMTRVEQGLAAPSTALALPPARLAVEALQRAFGRSRYLLRSLAVRSRLDLSRRMTGDRSRAGDWHRDSPRNSEDRHPARQVFDGLLLVRRQIGTSGDVDADRWRALAESALRVDPSSAFWQGISQRLADLGTDQGRTAADGIDRIIREIAPHAQKESLVRLNDLRRTPLSQAWDAERRR